MRGVPQLAELWETCTLKLGGDGRNLHGAIITNTMLRNVEAHDTLALTEIHDHKDIGN